MIDMECNNGRKRSLSAELEREESAKISKVENSAVKAFAAVKNCEVLNELKDKKVIFLRGKVPSETEENDAVVILEKTSFDTSKNGLQQWFTQDTHLNVVIQNDIYSSFTANPPVDLNQVKVTFIHPATEKHIGKYKRQKFFLIQESEEMYKNVTLPYLQKSQQFSIKWVENILDKKSESERIVFEDTDKKDGFILLPDMKWDGKNETLYLIALPHQRELKSIRDLNETNLSMLKNILNGGKKAILTKYNIPESDLLIYLHYQPSYYHLHVHFTHISFDAPGTIVSRAHLLTDVIENITMKSDYYQKKTLTYTLRENDKLLKCLKNE